MKILIFFVSHFTVLPPSRFDVAASGGVGPCFGEPPLPALPLQGGDDELFSPSGNGDISPICCADISPTFDKPYMKEMEKTIEGSRFCAQHVKNKDKFESVSRILIFRIFFDIDFLIDPFPHKLFTKPSCLSSPSIFAFYL